jgi:phosphatidate cytidylyltransferase
VILSVSTFEFLQFILPIKIEYDENNQLTKASRLRSFYRVFVIEVVCLFIFMYFICFSGFGFAYEIATEWARPQNLFINLHDHVAYIFILCSSFILWLINAVLVMTYPKSKVIVSNLFFKLISFFIIFSSFALSALVLRFSGYKSDPYMGSNIILSVMILVWCADSGAYFVGRAIGKHKMSPNVSPNKTIEGLLGGIACSLIAFVILINFNMFGIEGYSSNLYALTFAAICTVIISVFGDLMESVFKREAGIKDSGKIFPGHGGMLDRLDSVYAAFPMFIMSYALFEFVVGK